MPLIVDSTKEAQNETLFGLLWLDTGSPIAGIVSPQGVSNRWEGQAGTISLRDPSPFAVLGGAWSGIQIIPNGV